MSERQELLREALRLCHEAQRRIERLDCQCHEHGSEPHARRQDGDLQPERWRVVVEADR